MPCAAAVETIKIAIDKNPTDARPIGSALGPRQFDESIASIARIVTTIPMPSAIPIRIKRGR